MNSIKKLIGKFNQNTFFDLLSLGLIPLALILVCAITIAVLSFNSTKNQIKLNTENSIQTFYASNQEKINYAISTASVFVQDEKLLKYLSDKKIPLTQEVLSSTKRSILNYTNIFNYVDSIFLCNQDSNTIISANGSYSIQEYFNQHYSYFDYPCEYWKKILFWDDSDYRLLSPTTANSVSGEKTVLPVIIRSINNISLSTYIVINIDLDKLILSTPTTSPTSSTLYILNCFHNKALPIPKNSEDYIQLPAELYSELIKKPNNSFNFTINNKKHIVISHSNTATLNGYIFYYIIPFNELLSSQKTIYGIMAFQFLLFTLVAILILYKKTNTIYSPIKSIAKKLSIDADNINLTNIKNSTDVLMSQNATLHSTLPYAQEKYIINYLNSAEYTFDEETQNLLLQNLPFAYPYFVCVVIRFTPTDKMFQTFDTVEYNNIQHGLYNAVKNMYSNNFNAFFLSSEQNSVYVILNLENPSQKKDVTFVWERFLELLTNDLDYIKLYYGESDVHEDLTGLKQAHKQAIENLTFVMSEDAESKIKLSVPKSLITKSDESKLYDLLIGHEIKAAKTLIDSYSAKLNTSDIQTAKNFYSKVLGVIVKILQVKKITYTDTQQNDYEFISSAIDNDINTIHNTVTELLTKLETQITKKDKKRIIPYISENYSDSNLSLEYIASVFETNPSYISNFIKNNLNVGFHEYLTSLRVTQAKSLLIETKQPISEIGTSVGFSSRTTFFRCFKQDTGMTPSEFRKHYSHN